MDKKTLTFSEFCEYTGFGRNKAGKLLSNPRCNFSFKCGNKWYIIREKLDEYIQFCAENNLNIDNGYDKMGT